MSSHEQLKIARAMRAQLTQALPHHTQQPLEDANARHIVESIRVLYTLETLGAAALDATLEQVARHLGQLPAEVVEVRPQLRDCLARCQELAPRIERPQRHSYVNEKIAVDAARSLQEPIRVAVGHNSRHNFYTGLSGSISEGGVFISELPALPIGTILKVCVEIDKEHPIQFEGRVAWIADDAHSSGSGVGIGFHALDREDEITILRFLGHREPLLANA